MATLESNRLDKLRQQLEESGVVVNFVKIKANLAFQAIEDWFDKPAVKASLAADIEAAAPGVFNNTQKKQLAKFWLQDRFERE